MATLHSMGFPRIGAKRELKFALEKYWSNKIDAAELGRCARDLRSQNWATQARNGVDLVSVGDFSYYDTVLDMTMMLNNVPERFKTTDSRPDMSFLMARGKAPTGKSTNACDMTKWFNTNYHYIVPELDKTRDLKVDSTLLVSQLKEARQEGYSTKPIVVGPLTYLWLARTPDGADFKKLDLLPKLTMAYQQILRDLASAGAEWVQIDEPILSLELETEWLDGFRQAYRELCSESIKVMLASYFEGYGTNMDTVLALPVDGIHLDAVSALAELETLATKLANDSRVLSVGVVNGRNVWAADLNKILDVLEPIQAVLKERLWISSSCSLTLSPVDLRLEQRLDPELLSWLAFAVQKLEELAILKRALTKGRASVATELEKVAAVMRGRASSSRTKDTEVRERVTAVNDAMARRASAHAERIKIQRERNDLPLYPTTTTGSFPQTKEIRLARRDFKAGRISEQEYTDLMKAEIRKVVEKQEEYCLDVLVHGEPERNDMVEYFGEQLQGYISTDYGWVQSYGSRCVKPPIIAGDVKRTAPMTVSWATYAQSLTDKPVKGMLTGPVTMMSWAFVREDLPYKDICTQVALALRDEVHDLEKAGIKVIQMDEPAIKESMPLRMSQRDEYLDTAVTCFRIATAVVKDETQIHSHMCYSEFDDIMPHIAALDADVLLIESSRSDMELLRLFEEHNYPNNVGPGLFDIHSPNVPDQEAMLRSLTKAADRIPALKLWVTPDCGLKTRRWEEVDRMLTNMVATARVARESNLGA